MKFDPDQPKGWFDHCQKITDKLHDNFLDGTVTNRPWYGVPEYAEDILEMLNQVPKEYQAIAAGIGSLTVHAVDPDRGQSLAQEVNNNDNPTMLSNVCWLCIRVEKHNLDRCIKCMGWKWCHTTPRPNMYIFATEVLEEHDIDATWLSDIEFKE